MLNKQLQVTMLREWLSQYMLHFCVLGQIFIQLRPTSQPDTEQSVAYKRQAANLD